MVPPLHSIKCYAAIHKNEEDVDVWAWNSDPTMWTRGGKGKWYRRVSHSHDARVPYLVSRYKTMKGWLAGSLAGWVAGWLDEWMENVYNGSSVN